MQSSPLNSNAVFRWFREIVQFRKSWRSFCCPWRQKINLRFFQMFAGFLNKAAYDKMGRARCISFSRSFVLRQWRHNVNWGRRKFSTNQKSQEHKWELMSLRNGSRVLKQHLKTCMWFFPTSSYVIGNTWLNEGNKMKFSRKVPLLLANIFSDVITMCYVNLTWRDPHVTWRDVTNKDTERRQRRPIQSLRHTSIQRTFPFTELVAEGKEKKCHLPKIKTNFHALNFRGLQCNFVFIVCLVDVAEPKTTAAFISTRSPCFWLQGKTRALKKSRNLIYFVTIALCYPAMRNISRVFGVWKSVVTSGLGFNLWIQKEFILRDLQPKLTMIYFCTFQVSDRAFLVYFFIPDPRNTTQLGLWKRQHLDR